MRHLHSWNLLYILVWKVFRVSAQDFGSVVEQSDGLVPVEDSKNNEQENTKIESLDLPIEEFYEDDYDIKLDFDEYPVEHIEDDSYFQFSLDALQETETYPFNGMDDIAIQKDPLSELDTEEISTVIFPSSSEHVNIGGIGESFDDENAVNESRILGSSINADTAILPDTIEFQELSDVNRSIEINKESHIKYEHENSNRSGDQSTLEVLNNLETNNKTNESAIALDTFSSVNISDLIYDISSVKSLKEDKTSYSFIPSISTHSSLNQSDLFMERIRNNPSLLFENYEDYVPIISKSGSCGSLNSYRPAIFGAVSIVFWSTLLIS